MATPIRIKRSAVAGKRPALTDLQLGELALNTVDAELLTKRYRAGIGSDIVRVGAGATVTNVIFVTKDGNDENTGLKEGDAKATVGAALSIASRGSVIRISAGAYTEDNPLTVPKQVSIVGDSLREVSIKPQNQTSDLFYVSNGNYFGGMSFIGTMTSGNSIFRFNPDKIEYFDQSPYIRDCTNFVKNSIGLKIDGNAAVGPFKAMVLDSYTQYNENGIGCSITNEGYAQLVSMFTICPDTAVYVGTGGNCDLTNSNSSFGNYGLISDGTGPEKYVGVITTAASEDASEFVVDFGTDPYSITAAPYTGATGVVTVTTNTAHGFQVGMGVTLSNLAYTCLYGNYDHKFVSPATSAVGITSTAGRLGVTTSTYNPLTGDLVLTVGSGHGLLAASSHTISTATYTPATGVLNLTLSSHGFTGSTNHQAVSGTTYNPSTGILTIQVNSHGFAAGEKVKLDDDALTFTCAKDVHATSHTYPRSTDPASGKWLSIKSATTNTFDLDVGTSSYTGIHTFVSATSTGIKKANDFVKIANNSLTFTCEKDANATQHTYPRISDPVANTWIAIGSTTSNTFQVDVGKSPDTSTHALVSASSNGVKKANGTIGISTNSLTFTCDKDSHATQHTYPRTKDPVHDSVIGVESTDSTTVTVNVGVSTNDIFPGEYGNVFEVKSVPSSTSFTLNVGVNTHPHTYVEGGKVELDVLRPYEGQVVYFDNRYQTLTKITVGSGGTGYANAPTVTITDPSTSGTWGVKATASANISGGRVKSFDIISDGRGYTSTPTITISGPDSGINTATAVLTMSPQYYAITEATPLSGGISTITISENLPYAVGVGTTVPVFKQSKILASSHSFEYIGAGVTIGDALPHKGGLVLQDNEIADRNGGLTVFTSTDQTGNFRIGDGVIINQQTGTISGKFYSKSLFSTMTPFILALGGD
jgi:hypothetical protein